MFSNAYRLEVKKQKSEVYNVGMSYFDIRRVTNVSGRFLYREATF